MVTLGVSCKKENVQPNEVVKKEVLNKKANAQAESIGGYPGGQYTWPHSTGACYCGNYSNCHPPVVSTPKEGWPPSNTPTGDQSQLVHPPR